MNEECLQELVPAVELGYGNLVRVLSKTLRPMAVGMVSSVQHLSPSEALVHVQTADGQERIFSTLLYSFTRDDGKTSHEDIIAEKQGPLSSGDKLAPSKDSNSKTIDDPDSERDPPRLEKDVDPNKLPDDIQRSMREDDTFTPSDVDKVLSAVSESALDELKRTGAKSKDVYDLVSAIQKAVEPILSKYAEKLSEEHTDAEKAKPEKKTKPKDSRLTKSAGASEKDDPASSKKGSAKDEESD